MKRVALIQSLVVATLGSTAPLAQAQYTAYDLGTLGGSYSVAYGINNAGTIVGNRTTSDGVTHAFSPGGGVMTDLAPPTSPAWG